ncbi:MAG: helix-turn-helix transcriptional regulator [Candidatus Thorarchaeota archaeon]
MQRKIVVLTAFVIASLFILPVQGEFVTAQTTGLIIDPIDIKATMNSDGTTSVDVHARVVNLGSTAITSINFHIYSLEVTVIQASVNETISSFSTVLLNRYTEINIALSQPLDVNESVWFDIAMISTDLQSEPDEGSGLDPTRLQSAFVFYINPSIDFANFTFTAILPQDAMLSRESVVPIFPNTNLNFTDGDSLGFVWFIESLQSGQISYFTIQYQIPNDDLVSVQSDLLSAIIIALLGIMVGIILTLGGPKFYQRVRRIGKVRFVGVTTEEEEVLEVIRAKGGSCPQKDLYTEFEMSQAKVSLILNNLEERGLVRRFREGRENVVHIMED